MNDPIEDQIARRIEAGSLIEGCGRCERTIEEARKTGRWPIAPSHNASSRCESGKHPHCTCDTCF